MHATGTAALENQIVGLIRQAAAHIDTVNLTASLGERARGVD